MKLTPWQPKKRDVFNELLDWDYPFGSSLLPSLFQEKRLNGQDWYPAIDISEDKNNVYVKADLPGLKKEDIQVSVHNDVLTIKGERKSESEHKDKNFHRVERSYGVFQRTLELGSAVDKTKVKANYKDGVLDIIIPKTEETKAQNIVIENK
ncbi:MAG: Hsp20/alpha crystallin family protein [Candidatus Omnitrophica bacterium]|nr:Hsp20/alpha crystallin family protein [Candidatus Omnitrophota bacterium]